MAQQHGKYKPNPKPKTPKQPETPPPKPKKDATGKLVLASAKPSVPGETKEQIIKWISESIFKKLQEA